MLRCTGHIVADSDDLALFRVHQGDEAGKFYVFDSRGISAVNLENPEAITIEGESSGVRRRFSAWPGLVQDQHNENELPELINVTVVPNAEPDSRIPA